MTTKLFPLNFLLWAIYVKPNAVTFLQTLHLSLQSGKSLSEALRLMEHLPTSTEEKKIYSSVRRDVQRGVPFSEAYGRHLLAPNDIVQFVAMAEKGGSFRRMLQKVVHYLELKERFYQESSDKIGLPTIYFLLSTLIVLFVRFYAIPHHIDESLQYDKQIQVLIADHLLMAQWMGDILFGLLLMSALFFLSVLSALFAQKRTLQMIAKPLALMFPVSSKMMKQFEKFILFTLLGEMLQNGISFKKAIQSAHNSTDIQSYKKSFETIEESIHRGERQWWSVSLFEEIERRLLFGAGSMAQVGEVMVQLAEKARTQALLQAGKFFRLISVISILLMAFAVFVEFFTVVLTQVLIQKGIINAVEGSGGGF